MVNKANLFVKTILTMGLIGGSLIANANYSIERCSDDQLSTAAGKNRHAWGMECFPDYQNDVYTINYLQFDDDQINPAQTDANGNLSRRDPSDMDFKVYIGNVKESPEWGYPGFHHVKRGKRTSPWGIGTSRSKGSSCAKPADVRYTRICPAGCYSGNQFVLVSEGYLPIADINSDKVKGIITLTKDSNLQDLKFQETELLKVVKDSSVTKQMFLNIVTDNGQIEVTENHPMLLSSGKMVQAKTLIAEMELLKADGSSAKIEKIQRNEKEARAYNVIAKTPMLMEKIVVAQGFLTGDLYYQNAGTKYLNRLLIRSQDLIPSDAL